MNPFRPLPAVLALALCAIPAVCQAQTSAPLGISVGLKAWQTQWTTFSYDTNAAAQPVVTQVPARDKLVLVPLLSLRYRDFVGSISGYAPTRYEFLNGASDARKEFDANLGYFVVPGLALTLGYKRVRQQGASDNYELGGLVAGASATAPLGGPLSLYGSLGLGRMKDTAASTVKFKADYRLTELGLAYNLATAGLPKAVSFTAGYRTQVFSSKEALGEQDGRDLTQGLTVGVVVGF